MAINSTNTNDANKESGNIENIDNVGLATQESIFSSSAQTEVAQDANFFSDMLEESFRLHPSDVAVAGVRQSHTYGDLDKRSAEIIVQLRLHGIRRGDVVAVLFDRGFEYIAAVCAMVRHGCVFLPLDPDYPVDRLSFMVRDASARLILSGPAHEGLANELRSCVSPAENDLHDHACQNSKDAPVYIIYTSGTTGRPKGVQICANGLANFVAGQIKYLDVDRGSRFIQNSSICFDMSIWEIFLSLCAGASIAVVSKETLQDGRAFAHALAEFRVSHILLTPSMLSVIPFTPLPTLRCIVSAGEKCSQGLIDKWAPGRRFYDAYGATEATVYTTIGECFAGQVERNVGQSMAGTSVHVLDANLNRLQPGEVGDVYIGGIGVSKGYINRDELTRERFVASAYGPLYKTGDLGALTKDGALLYKGRIDNQIKVNGYRIELEEIEAAANADPRVDGSHATVLTIGQQSSAIVLYVVFVRPNAMSVRELKALLAHRLPRYMVPSFIVELPGFPLTGSGKINTKQLPIPVSRSESMLRSHNEPQRMLEYKISAIWSMLLGHDSFKLEDSFFDVGGHSLLANQLFAAIEKEFGIDLPVSTIFSHESIISLSQAIRDKQDDQRFSPLVKLRDGSDRKALYCIHPGGGSLFCYHELVKRLPQEWKAFGLQSRNADFASSVQYRTIEEMASDYVKCILDSDAVTEIRLIGWSSGGLIAFEMARLFHQAGVDVQYLGLVDSYLSGRYVEEIDLEDKPAFVHRVIHGRLLDAVPDRIRQKISDLPENEAIHLIYRDAQAQGVIPNNVALERVLRSVEMHKENCFASRKYRPTGYDGTVSFIRATGNDDIAANPLAGWDKVAVHRRDVTEINADHYTIMDDAHIDAVLQSIHA